MLKSLNIGRSGLNTYQKKLDITSNNVANVSTTGYKKMDTPFEDLLQDVIEKNGTPYSEKAIEDGKSVGNGVKESTIKRDYSQGVFLESNNKTHLAIDGKGFFGVLDKNGDTLLTRDGTFSIGDDGKLIDKNGNTVIVHEQVLDPEFSNNISIKSDGSIYGYNTDMNEKKLGKITLYDTVDRNNISSVDGNYYIINDEDKLFTNIDNNNFGSIKSGFTEGSNVNLTDEIVNMIMTQKSYSMNVRGLQTTDEMWQMINNIR